MDKQKIFRIKVIDVLQDDVVYTYDSCDIDKIVSLLNDFEGYPRRLIISTVEFRDIKVFDNGDIIRF